MIICQSHRKEEVEEKEKEEGAGAKKVAKRGKGEYILGIGLLQQGRPELSGAS